MQKPVVTIGVILFTGCEKYLPQSLTSLVDQDYPHCEFLLRDQSPNSEVFDWIHKNLPKILPKAHLEKGENRMHSGGHNALIAKMKGDLYFCVSNDMWYPKDFVSKMVAELEKPENLKYGSATCKLMQWDFEKNVKTDVIDSAGIGLTKTHHFFDVGQGETNHGQYDGVRDIFGPSGALGVYRKKALQDVGPEYFDEMLYYKNDVDLSYRLQWAGWPSLLVPSVRVWHDRQVASKGASKSIIAKILRSRTGKSQWIKENSFFGQLVVIRKYYTADYSLSVRFRTWVYRMQGFIFALIFEPFLLKQYKIVSQHSAEIDMKRKQMKRVARPADIEKLML